MLVAIVNSRDAKCTLIKVKEKILFSFKWSHRLSQFLLNIEPKIEGAITNTPPETKTYACFSFYNQNTP